MGDQVTPQTEATPEQRAACMADVDKVIAHAGVSATGKVRIEPAWTDPETGERFGSSWVAEVRVRRAASFVAIVMEVADHAANPAAWCEFLDEEIRQARPRAGMRQEPAPHAHRWSADQPGGPRCLDCGWWMAWT